MAIHWWKNCAGTICIDEYPDLLDRSYESSCDNREFHSQNIFHFIWVGKPNEVKFHLSRWESLSWPKRLSGWGLLNLDWFNQALIIKILWRVLTDEGLCILVVRSKYLKIVSPVHWINNLLLHFRNASLIWRSIIATFPYISEHLSWQIGNGMKVHIGIDPYVGAKDDFSLSNMLLEWLHNKHLLMLSQIFQNGEHPHCLSTEELGLSRDYVQEWDSNIKNLTFSGISLSEEQDKLVWDRHDANGCLSVKKVYELPVSKWWHKMIWRWNILMRMKCFIWKCFENKILT